MRVFGSVARGEAGAESDVDLLIDLEPGRSLLDHVALLQDSEDILSLKVDVVNGRSQASLHQGSSAPGGYPAVKDPLLYIIHATQDKNSRILN